MERFITGGCEIIGDPIQQQGFVEYRNPKLSRASYRPKLKHIAIDIETDGLDGALYSIAAASAEEAVVFMAATESQSETRAPIVLVQGRERCAQAVFPLASRDRS